MIKFSLNMISENYNDILPILKIIFSHIKWYDNNKQPQSNIKYWKESKIDGKNALVFFAYDFGLPNQQLNKFPCPMSAEPIEKIITEWLKNIEYPSEPTTDVSTKRAFEIIVKDYWKEEFGNAEFAIMPTWTVYGK